MLTEEQRKEFELLSKPLIKWLNNNRNPHAKIIIDSTSVDLVEGISSIKTEEFIKD